MPAPEPPEEADDTDDPEEPEDTDNPEELDEPEDPEWAESPEPVPQARTSPKSGQKARRGTRRGPTSDPQRASLTPRSGFTAYLTHPLGGVSRRSLPDELRAEALRNANRGTRLTDDQVKGRALGVACLEGAAAAAIAHAAHL